MHQPAHAAGGGGRRYRVSLAFTDRYGLPHRALPAHDVQIVGDDWRSHAYDTVKGSDYLGDQDAIEIMCSEAPAEVMHLEHIGVNFHRNDNGELDLRAFGGASMKRTAYVADITGQAMLHVLYEQLMKHHETVDTYEEWFTTSLLRDADGRCCGVV